MRPFWHPLSTLSLVDPPCFATATLVRMMLAAEGALEIRYSGDRMGAACPDGALVPVSPVDVDSIATGDVLVASVDGIPDLLRLHSRSASRLLLVADEDPADPVEIEPGSILARAKLPRRVVTSGARRFRRLLADVREARRRGPDPAPDPAATVLEKYDAQAVFYARSRERDLDSGLLGRIRASVPVGGRWIVIGSGTGKECFPLAESGFRVTGLDFAPAMVTAAREEAAARSADVEFVAGDARTQEFPDGQFDGVLFSYDVYSFVPSRVEREALLRRVRSWLAPQGVVLLSARRVLRLYERAILTIQRSAGPAGREWGDSHTRWVAADGAVRRSYVRYFGNGQLEREIRAAGFRLEEWRDAHGLLRTACYHPGREDPR